MSVANGTKLGPYEILSLLGGGGMGEVYRATDTRLGREVAVKVLPPEFAQDPESLRRFEQLARARGELPKYLEKPMDELLKQLEEQGAWP